MPADDRPVASADDPDAGAPPTPTDVTELQAEVERLRGLVGPSEAAYADLVADVDGAREAARLAAAEAGELRGRIAELHVQLARARQDQERVQRARDAMRAARRRVRRLVRRR